jgi:hypothetical protein
VDFLRSVNSLSHTHDDRKEGEREREREIKIIEALMLIIAAEIYHWTTNSCTAFPFLSQVVEREKTTSTLGRRSAGYKGRVPSRAHPLVKTTRPDAACATDLNRQTPGSLLTRRSALWISQGVGQALIYNVKIF